MRLRMAIMDGYSGKLYTVHDLLGYEPIVYGDKVVVLSGQLVFTDYDRLSLYLTGYIPDYLPPLAIEKIREWDKAWTDWFQTYTANTDLELWIAEAPPDILEINEKQLELNL